MRSTTLLHTVNSQPDRSDDSSQICRCEILNQSNAGSFAGKFHDIPLTVGTPVTGRPPHSPGRAVFPHRKPNHRFLGCTRFRYGLPLCKNLVLPLSIHANRSGYTGPINRFLADLSRKQMFPSVLMTSNYFRHLNKGSLVFVFLIHT